MQRQVTLYSTEKLHLVSTSTNSLWMASGTLLHIRHIQKRQQQVIHTCCKDILYMLSKLDVCRDFRMADPELPSVTDNGTCADRR